MVLHNTTIPPTTIFLKSNQATNKINGTLNSDIVYELKNKIIIPNNVDCYISTNQFKFINAFYNVNSTCNKFYYTVYHSGITESITVTIPNGNYSITAILQYLNTATAIHHIDGTYLDTLFKINFTSSGGHTFYLQHGQNDCLRILGFLVVGSTLGNTYTSDSVINLSGTQCLYVSLENVNLSSNGCVSAQNTNIIESINVEVLIGSSQSYSNTNNSKFKVYENFISSINVKIYDEYNNLVDFNGTDYFLSLGLIFVYKMEYRPPTMLDLNNNGIDDNLEGNTMEMTNDKIEQTL